MKKKIIFVNPPITRKERYKNLADAGNDLPPLGLATLAAVTREAGYDTEILDAPAFDMETDEAANWLIKENPNYIGITAVTLSIFRAASLAKTIKKFRPDITVILGGPHLTAVPEETMQRFPEFDIGVWGEGEDTIIELLEALGNNQHLRDVKGLVLRDGKQVNLTKKRPFIKDLDKLPFPAFDLLPDLVEFYQPAADSLNRTPSSLLITSRGCPGQCNFCDKRVFGNGLRAFSAEYVINMIKDLQAKYGIKDFFIQDDNFLVFNKRLIQICNLIINENIDVSWSCLGRVDNIDLDLLILMKKAGCWQVNFGCESGSQDILNILNKKVTIEKIEKAVRMTRQAGMKVKGLFMMGNFGETKKTANQTIDFIKRLPMTDFHITCFTPLPGAPAWYEAAKYGSFDPDWRKVDMFSATNFVPNGFTKDELEKYYRRAWMAFYFKPRVIFDYLLKLKDRRMRKKIIMGSLGFVKFLVKKAI